LAIIIDKKGFGRKEINLRRRGGGKERGIDGGEMYRFPGEYLPGKKCRNSPPKKKHTIFLKL